MTHESKRIRVLIAKTSLDGHWRGPAVVSAALRDAGMEVVYSGVLNAEEIMATAEQEDVDVIGLNVGGDYTIAKELMQHLSKKDDFGPLVIAGGTLPPPDIPLLKAMGIAEVFPPGSRLDSIVNYIKSAVGKRNCDKAKPE